MASNNYHFRSKDQFNDLVVAEIYKEHDNDMVDG